MWWKILFVVLLVIQEIEIILLRGRIENLTLIFETIIHGKILSITEKNKDGTIHRVYTNEKSRNEDDDAGF